MSTTAKIDTDATDESLVVGHAAPSGIVVERLSPTALEQLSATADDGTTGGNRAVWFLFGFIAALVGGALAAIGFLAVSDADDDGTVNLDVPAVEVQP